MITAGITDVLARWSGTWTRPAAIVPVPSRRHRERIAHLAHHVASCCGVPVLDALQRAGATAVLPLVVHCHP